jgi:hypothetical protein
MPDVLGIPGGRASPRLLLLLLRISHPMAGSATANCRRGSPGEGSSPRRILSRDRCFSNRCSWRNPIISDCASGRSQKIRRPAAARRRAVALWRPADGAAAAPGPVACRAADLSRVPREDRPSMDDCRIREWPRRMSGTRPRRNATKRVEKASTRVFMATDMGIGSQVGSGLWR